VPLRSKLLIRKYLKQIKPLRAGVRVLRSAIIRQRENIYVLEGNERNSQQPLSVLFAGNQLNKNYIAQLIFGESWTDAEHIRIWKNNLLRHTRSVSRKHAMMIIQSDGMSEVTQFEANLFQVPCWVGGVKNLRAYVEFAQHSNHIKSDIRRIRKNRFDYRVTREPEEFDRFYYNMYLPYIKHVFSDHAFLMSYQAMQEAIPQCELLLITQDGQDIAGGILVYDGSDRVRGWSLGVKEGDSRWVKAGALAAFEHLQTNYLLERDFGSLHRGASRPFLNDGALCFKKNRGMELTDHTSQSFVIKLLSDGPGARAFLQNNPFIYKDEETLSGAIFVAEETFSRDDVPRLWHDWYLPGLKCLTLFCIREGHSGDSSLHICGQIDKSSMLNASASLH